ncbi:hypothetical protein H1R20_g6077, partial [Candolleomyces eurysporus]
MIGSRMRFNNATQRLFGDLVRAVIIVWETKDWETPWSAEARIVSNDDNKLVWIVGQGSASQKKQAKDMAANSAYQWLVIQYPSIDLINV